jgi:hypothetical protein
LRERIEIAPHPPVAVKRLAMRGAGGDPLEKIILLARRQSAVVPDEPFGRSGLHGGVE